MTCPGHIADIESEFTRIKKLVEQPAAAVDLELGEAAGVHPPLVLPEMVLAAERVVGPRSVWPDKQKVRAEGEVPQRWAPGTGQGRGTGTDGHEQPCTYQNRAGRKPRHKVGRC